VGSFVSTRNETGFFDNGARIGFEAPDELSEMLGFKIIKPQTARVLCGSKSD